MDAPTQLAARTRDELIEHAATQAGHVMALRTALVTIRRERGLTQTHLAEMLGVSVAEVAEVERYDSDPHISMIDRYALAVGAMIEFTVTATPLPAKEGSAP